MPPPPHREALGGTLGAAALRELGGIPELRFVPSVLPLSVGGGAGLLSGCNQRLAFLIAFLRGKPPPPLRCAVGQRLPASRPGGQYQDLSRKPPLKSRLTCRLFRGLPCLPATPVLPPAPHPRESDPTILFMASVATWNCRMYFWTDLSAGGAKNNESRFKKS